MCDREFKGERPEGEDAVVIATAVPWRLAGRLVEVLNEAFAPTTFGAFQGDHTEVRVASGPAGVTRIAEFQRAAAWYLNGYGHGRADEREVKDEG